MRLSVVVPATDSPATLEACLLAIAAASDPPDEVIVVDHPVRSGPAAARNAGARAASGSVLVFVDSDVLVHRDVFSRIRAAF
ncbi:MAG: glycosyltransferase family 2 protein, partial [Thermoleophilaceae bacterium]|nr:glycosyltransferase family 2 protein [Thermoleophilaceae bacterium]